MVRNDEKYDSLMVQNDAYFAKPIVQNDARALTKTLFSAILVIVEVTNYAKEKNVSDTERMERK